MEAQGLGTHQSTISPGQGLLQGAAITGSAQLGGATGRGGETAIEADRQHQAQAGQGDPSPGAERASLCLNSTVPGLGGLQGVQPAAARASRAAGAISSRGASANTSAALLGLS